MSTESILVEVVGVVAVLSLYGVVGSLVRRRRAPSATPLTLFVGCLTTWATVVVLFPTLGERLGTELFEGVGWSILAAGAALFAPVFWFWYAVEYTGRGRLLTRGRLVLLGLPAAVAVVVAYGFLITGPSAGGTLNPVVALFLVLELLYALGLVLLGTYLLSRLSLTYNQFPVGQVVVLGGATGVPYVGSFMNNITVPESGEMVPLSPVDLTSIGFLVAALLLGTAVWRYPVVTVLPEAETVARDEVVEELQEGVVVLDRTGDVLDLNATATRILDRPATAVLGTPVESLLGVPVDDLGDEPRAIELQTADGVRRFELNASSLGDDDDPIGRTVVLRDVTERETREQRLQVLNRVLRHNLRNDLDVILAHADTVEDPETRSAIREQARGLVDMATKARDTERLLDSHDGSVERVDVVEVVEGVADRLRSRYERAEISVTAPEALTIRSRRSVVDRIVTELVENGIEHDESTSPRVDLRVRRDPGADRPVKLRVADGGPGISGRELEILQDGVESPHRHGTGFGLRLVSHAVTHIGGELSFETAEDGGTVATVSLPDVTAD